MILTTPNLEKHVNAILGVFKRNKNNVRPYEYESLESVLKHIESSLNGRLNGFSLTESLVGLLMFHYTIAYGGAKEASQQLKRDITLGKESIGFKLHQAILNASRLELTKDLEIESASKERIDFIIDKFENEYTQEAVFTSIKKTTHDLLTIANNNKNEFF